MHVGYEKIAILDKYLAISETIRDKAILTMECE